MRTIADIPFCADVEEILVERRSALLIVDMQNDFCTTEGHFDRNGKDIKAIRSIVPKVVRLLAAARDHHVPVLFAKQTTMPNLASDSPAWLYFKTRDGKSPDYTIDGTWGQDIISDLTVRSDDVVLKKFRPSAFHRTDLAASLNARKIEALVIAGCITQGCVQATATDASYNDYYVVIAEDCVQSTSQAFHENALQFLRSRYDVISSAAIHGYWANGSKSQLRRAAGATDD
ncbi:MAG TPA: cysteine hydrolase [Candidatus Saccharimonadales bacterium]|nr:cysteine hydrolase [Candidatus Saccharimonadales bacterium]